MRYFTVILIMLASFSLQAQECRAVLAKFPKHSPDSSVFAKQVSDYIKNCEQRPNADDPDVLRNCIIVGMRSLAISGNYVAAEQMAIKECEQGNEEVSKHWLGLIINNQNASEEERMLANQVVNGENQPLPPPMRTPGLQQGTINK